MLDLTVIILVGKEELHIRRCLEKLAPLEARQVVVVESQSGDETHALAVAGGATTVFHDYPGNQAAQFQWALDHLTLEGEWILRLDADEYLTDELIREFKEKLPKVGRERERRGGREDRGQRTEDRGRGQGNVGQATGAGGKGRGQGNVGQATGAGGKGRGQGNVGQETGETADGKIPAEVMGVILRRRHIWRGDWVKRGMYPTRILRLFRRGHGKSDGKLMDEHILVDGAVIEFEHDFVDHSLITLDAWEAKHRNYAKREAESFLAGEKSHGPKALFKWCYYHLLPARARPAIYWFKRAILDGAYFESPAARDFTYRHAFWYRTLVEQEIKRLSTANAAAYLRSRDFTSALDADYERLRDAHKLDQQ